MKILIVHRLIAAFGGAHKYLTGLIDRLAASGWDIHLAINPNPDIGELVQAQANKGVQIHPIDYDRLGSAELGQVMDQLIQDISPDVIDFEAAAKSLRQLALNSNRFKDTTAHKLFTMHLPIVTDRSSLRSWKRHIPLSHARTGIHERKAFLKLFDSGLSVSQYHANDINSLVGISQKFFTVIPNGVDIEEFHPPTIRQKDKNSQIKIISCGGLTKQKRFDLLILAAIQMKQLNFQIEIAGEGVERDKLTQQIKQLELSDKVFLKGHIRDIPSFLRTGDIYVVCSDSEGLPYAALEAMATGLPMVVTRVGELPYMIRQGIEGLVVNCNDPQELSLALLELVNSAHKRKTMGDACLVRARQDFNAAINWSRVDDKYRDLALNPKN
ncbi:glycosyltransferase family 4 protein [Pseudomaricurvus alcaniphilus]|uniref:glycosyltransferase family 4 protein n=1 Tax=Pseudomaricurvus alcaniphilus TaxID=1166482 RepID=UPI001409A4BB|nr:glycosyltransferase family 4 protein [Pseudomaricurvus alcaniphilus]NHN36720.1 glycosyltransferase family 4 protein [Pseudomaricurvus alcaniphilus]